MLLTHEFADRFAAEWIAAWNAHDIDRVLSHYCDDFEMTSPYIVQIANERSGVLKGKQAIGDYWRQKYSFLLPMVASQKPAHITLDGLAFFDQRADQRQG
jgi:ketosteroid isomerase-like protein